MIPMGNEGKKPRYLRRDGQVSILFALVFTFMFILFAFVVDFGHLINDKINLQLAADSAAYAGAAWQARTLDQMGMINYHMRQDIKELAMRLHVTHLRHNRNYPRGPQFINGAPQAPNVEPWICQQAHGYQAISGLRYANDTNLCRNASPSVGGLPPIVVPPVIAAFDPFAVAIAAQIRKIADAANQECRAAADDNRILANYLRDVYTKRSQFHAGQMRAMEGFLNEVGSGEVTDGDDNPIRKVAYQSAVRNSTISNRNFKMEIIEPEGGKYVELNEYKLNGTIFFINFNVVGDGCVGRPSFVDFDQMTGGFSKRRDIVTYFAVKLTSSPEMLFMPQAWVDAAFPKLEAFAAAKPFGSRIGPEGVQDQLLPTANRPGNNNRMINFSFKPGDNLGILNTKIMAYLDALHPSNAAGRPDGNQTSGWPDPTKGENLRLPLEAIRAPTIFDALLYPIYPDAGANKDADWLEAQFAEQLYPDYLESSDPNGTIIQTPTPKTAAYLPGDVGSRNRGQGWIQIDAAGSSPGGPYNGYADESPASHSVVLAGALPEIGGKEAEFGFATKEILHSSYAPPGKPGRLGYSVKMVGLDALRKLKVTLSSGGSGGIANKPSADADGNIDITIH